MRRGEPEIVTQKTNNQMVMNSTNCQNEQVCVQGAEPQLIPVKHASSILNISTHCLYRKIREGTIPAFRCGRKILVDIKEVKDSMRIK
jgi:excisionase family DNA binding protein